ncbi:MAG: hypothetical protein ACK4UR_05325 [Caldimicrobium sp.]
MYISRKITSEGYEYCLCESYYDPPYYKTRVLIELGKNPEDYITYYSDVAFSIDLEEALLNVGKKTDQFELEELFFRFLKREAQRWVSYSINRKNIFSKEDAKDYDLNKIHWFDKVRLIALKLDHRDPYRVVNYRFSFLKSLFKKSRDEIENFLWDMEDKLNFRESLNYILSIFSLHKTKSVEERDRIFLENLCKIAKDPQYYLDLSEKEVLAKYLSRYVWIYYDYLPYRRVPKYYQDLEKNYFLELSKVLNMSVEILQRSSKKEILKLFRKKILEVHPDRGGNKEDFIRIRKLMEIYLKNFSV